MKLKMNVFIIPSWYPSNTNPAWGIFCKEQAQALAKNFPDSNFGVSLWGQNNDNTLLFAKDHVKNLKKIIGIRKLISTRTYLCANLVEVNSPALSWTRKIIKGNIEGIVKANEDNFISFSKRFGKIDVVHAHVGYPAGYIAMRLARKFKIPYIITEHMAPFPFDSYKDKKGNLIRDLNSSYKNASQIIAVSDFLKQEIKDALIKKVTFIPNLVDESFFIPKDRRNNQEHFNFIFIGGLIERKGIDLLLNAFSMIPNTVSVTLKIVGEGELESYFKAHSKLKGIDHRIEWLGLLNRAEVMTEIQNSDVMVLSSKKENMPMVLLEAIACGKPLISTKCRGPEMIINSANGLLVEVGDEKGLADAMVVMIKTYSKYNPTLIREDFIKRFSSSVVTDKIMKIYRKVIVEYY